MSLYRVMGFYGLVGFVNGWSVGVAESDRRLEFHFLPIIGGVVSVAVRGSFVIAL